jgi:hypothetical protein
VKRLFAEDRRIVSCAGQFVGEGSRNTRLCIRVAGLLQRIQLRHVRGFWLRACATIFQFDGGGPMFLAALWLLSLRIDSSAAARIARRHCVESRRGLIVASDARSTHPSARAGRRYHSASIGLVRLKSLVEVTIRIGQLRAGSKPTGKVNTPALFRVADYHLASRHLETISLPESEFPQ